MGEKDPFEEAYRAARTRRKAPPWDVGHPQEVVVGLECAGLIEGPVLDAGCGTGEHTLLLAALGYDVLGIDSSPAAIAEARDKAKERGIAAAFECADALLVGARGESYATVIDTGLFHVFDAETRARYAAALHRACRPGARVHVLSLSDTPADGFPPGAGEADHRRAFGAGWQVEAFEAAPFTCLDPTDPRREVDVPGWLARIRRV
jgi:2-polyprenyl-3-methyl-5-hydroxy-6-metoxy-1,4-benzoquinol methylase